MTATRNHLTTVKLALRDAWREQCELGEITPTFDYSWPGQHAQDRHVWFYGGDADYSHPRVNAGVKFRDVVASFDVIAEVWLTGPMTDQDGAVVLQQQADEELDQITGWIEQWVAANDRLGFTPDAGLDIVVRVALIESEGLEHGPTDRGAGARRTMTIAYQAIIR